MISLLFHFLIYSLFVKNFSHCYFGRSPASWWHCLDLLPTSTLILSWCRLLIHFLLKKPQNLGEISEAGCSYGVKKEKGRGVLFQGHENISCQEKGACSQDYMNVSSFSLPVPKALRNSTEPVTMMLRCQVVWDEAFNGNLLSVETGGTGCSGKCHC